VFAVLERLHLAQNRHDLEAFVACFAPDYQSEQPVHPDRAFRGREQVRTNWSTVFSEMPDFHAELLRASADDDTAWAEWRWTGTQADGGRFDWRGVTIFGVTEDQITWGRLYLEPVQETRAGIDAAVRGMVRGSAEGS
jgi:ketosteroid isomerase-like protein